MANYKKLYDLEWSDLFMNKCNEVSRNQSKSRRYAKRQASKAARRANKKAITEFPVTKYEGTATAIISGWEVFDPITDIALHLFTQRSFAEEWVANQYTLCGIELDVRKVDERRLTPQTFSTFDEDEYWSLVISADYCDYEVDIQSQITVII